MLQPQTDSDLAGVYFWYDYDWLAATREFKRAIPLNPNERFAHEYYGWLLVTLGDAAAGIAEGHKAVDIDPLSSEASVVLAQDLYLLRRYGDALDVLRKCADLDPEYPLTYWTLGAVHLAQGHAEDAIVALEKGHRANDWITEELAASYATAGRRTEATNILKELDDRAKRGGYVAAYYLSYAYLALGDRNRALAALEEDYAHRSPNMTYLHLDPLLDPLRSEPRFKALVSKLNLPSVHR